MTKAKYRVIIQKSEYGYSASVPVLPGCHSQGDTEEEVLENVRDAIALWLKMEEAELKGLKIREVEVALA